MRITREEAAGLWHAVEWMKLCLKDSAPDVSVAALEQERKRLAAAKRALRKVQQIRRDAPGVADTISSAMDLLDEYRCCISESHTNPATGKLDCQDAADDVDAINRVIAGLVAVGGFDLQRSGSGS